MAIKLNHTIVHARDKHASAEFYSSLFGLGKPGPSAPPQCRNRQRGDLAFFETQDPSSRSTTPSS